MTRPTPRKPDTYKADALAPAPDTGKPFSTETGHGITTGSTETKQQRRAGVQLGLRIPEDLAARLKDASERTDVPQTKLVVRAIRRELDRLDREE